MLPAIQFLVSRLMDGLDRVRLPSNGLLMKFPNEMVKLLRGGGGELVSFLSLSYPNSFFNSLIISQLSHVTRRPDFFILDRVPDPRASPRRRQSP